MSTLQDDPSTLAGLRSGLTTAVNSPMQSQVDLSLKSGSPKGSLSEAATELKAQGGQRSVLSLHAGENATPGFSTIPQPSSTHTYQPPKQSLFKRVSTIVICGDPFIPKWATRTGEGEVFIPPVVPVGGSLYPGSGTEADPFVVDWLPNEPRNPYNWTNSYKWLFTGNVALATLCIAFASSCYSGAAGALEEAFSVSKELVIVGISVYVLGFGFGPLLWSPISEICGRRIPFLISFLPFALFNLGGVLARTSDFPTIIITRFFAGLFGSSMLTNAGGCIADLWSARERGLAMSLFSLAPFLGPVIGPIVGGFVGISGKNGWRWVFLVMLGFGLVMCVAGFFLLPECYPPVLLRRKASALQIASSDSAGVPTAIYRSKYDLKTKTVKEIISTNMTRPFQLLFREPIVLLLGIYVAIIYGILYLFFTAYPIVFQSPHPRGYGFGPGIGALPFIGIGVGMIIGTCLTPLSNKFYYRAMKASPTGIAPPESRLPMSIIGAWLLPVGLFMFAWTGGPERAHWMVPCVAGMFFGTGMLLVFTAVMSYTVDCYLLNAASALAANAVLRSLLGAVFPLFSVQMYDRLGDAWASSLLGFLALACAPFPYLFYVYGPTIRKRSRYAPNVTPATGQKASSAATTTNEKQRSQEAPIGLPAQVGAEEVSREGSMYSNLEPEWGSQAGDRSRGNESAPREMMSEKEERFVGEKAV